jgi:hypothetical protein
MQAPVQENRNVRTVNATVAGVLAVFAFLYYVDVFLVVGAARHRVPASAAPAAPLPQQPPSAWLSPLARRSCRGSATRCRA